VRIHVEILLLNFFLLIFYLIFFSSDQRCSVGHRTSLHLAARHGHTAACQLLISAAADVNATDLCAFMFKICYLFFFLIFSSDFLF
jgi:hypothetical protein